ncbi:MAG TPA: ATP-grasp domain-containing protein [Gaiellaceae bacterium]|nr:ATP-grasp domain-containing protein [Gaiellaceae bacterium]
MEGDSRSGSPRLLVLGAGPAQLGLLEAAHERGLWVAVVDRDPAAPGFRFADRRCILSTEDEPAIERLMSALAIDGVVSPGTDWPVGVAARAAERSGLPHPIEPATAVLATNKLRQRERLGAAGVPQPRWWVVGGEDAPPAVSGPVVVKAPDRQGQKGLTLVEDPADLPDAIERARAAARNGIALVEELVDGPEVTVVGFSVGGVFHGLTVTDRVVADPPAFGVALAHVWPSEVSDTLKVSDIVTQALMALGIANGPSYTQLRIDAQGPKVVEVAARLGGGHDAELVQAVTGIDLNGLTIDAAVGAELVLTAPKARVGGAVTKFLVAPPGVLERVDVPDGLEGVQRVRIYREPGCVFAPLRRGADRAGALLVTGDSRDEALARANAAADRIRFVTADAGSLREAI